MEETKEETVEIYTGISDDLTVAKKLVNLHQSAASRGIECTLSFKNLKTVLNTKRCFYTNIPFEKEGINSRTIDRVDAAIGYTDDNIVACTLDMNQKKTNLTIQDIWLLAKNIDKHLKKLSKKID